MGQGQHRLEKRSSLLAARVKEQVAATRDAVAAPGERPPFTTEMTRAQALEFWSRERHTPLGTSILRGWGPDKIAELDAALADHLSQSSFAPDLSTVAGAPPSIA